MSTIGVFIAGALAVFVGWCGVQTFGLWSFAVTLPIAAIIGIGTGEIFNKIINDA